MVRGCAAGSRASEDRDKRECPGEQKKSLLNTEDLD
jgi:hypothetical protein